MIEEVWLAVEVGVTSPSDEKQWIGSRRLFIGWRNVV